MRLMKGERIHSRVGVLTRHEKNEGEGYACEIMRDDGIMERGFASYFGRELEDVLVSL